MDGIIQEIIKGTSQGHLTKHLVMAPKLMPDNLMLPEENLLALDRNVLDKSIFPLSHHSGQVTLAPNSYVKEYTPAPPLASPYKDTRLITDIRSMSEIDFNGEFTYHATPAQNSQIARLNPAFARTIENIYLLDPMVDKVRTLISQRPKTRKEKFPGEDVEIITLGTGSAAPNKRRNGILPQGSLI
jgi:hypothetical protein